MLVSVYKNTFDKDSFPIEATNLMVSIKSCEYNDTIDYLRTLTPKEYKSEKQKLAAVTWSGVFKSGTRSIDTIETYSQLVCLDVDDVDPSNIELIRKQMTEDEFICFFFISPSGKGFKFGVKVNTGAKDHRSAFLHLQHHYETKYGLKIDPSGKDVCRLCYISADENAIIKSGTTFTVDLKYGEIITSNVDYSSFKATNDLEKTFAVCKKWVERNKTYQEGERNVYIHALACAFNRCGIDMDDAIKIIASNYDTPDQKWHQSVRSAYFHNLAEHGSVQIRDLGVQEFVAPHYISNYTDDVAKNDLMQLTAQLYHYGMPVKEIGPIVSKVAKFYQSKGWVDINRASLADLMNAAIAHLKEKVLEVAGQNALKYESAEDMVDDIISIDMSSMIKMYLDNIDMTTGGLALGNFYGIIGFGETFKSILAQYVAFQNAVNGIPVLYINGEMSKLQYFERLVLQATGKKLRVEIANGRVTKENSASLKEEIRNITNGNLFVHSGLNFTKKSILAAIEHFEAASGKKIRLVFMDGMSQMDQLGKEEAPANIANSMICKEIAKQANGGEGIALVALMHCSGAENKTLRNTGTVIRGGTKVIANLDGYISTSRFIDPSNVNMDNPGDVNYIEDKFCLRFADKRGGTGVNYAVIKVDERLMLSCEPTDYKQYEIKLQ